MNDYNYKMNGFELTAEPSNKTLDRLAATTQEFARKIIEREEQIILNNLPDDALKRLKETIDSIIETRGLNDRQS